jgi:hypothetical protein
VHESDCLNSITRQIVIEVDKYSSWVEVAFRIAYIFQVPTGAILPIDLTKAGPSVDPAPPAAARVTSTQDAPA